MVVTRKRTSCGPHQTAVRQIVLRIRKNETRQFQELGIGLQDDFSLCFKELEVNNMPSKKKRINLTVPDHVYAAIQKFMADNGILRDATACKQLMVKQLNKEVK